MNARNTLLLTAVVLLLAATGAARLLYREAGVDMTESAQAFLATLSDEQRAQATMPFDDAERTDWHFIPKPQRKGLQVGEMNDEQRQAAHRLLQAALSEAGYSKAVDIMSLEEILRALEGEQARFRRDPLRYYFTLFGTPAGDEKWGLSVEGHHLSLNFVVAEGKVVSHTPAFFGANPAIVKTDLDVGPPKGTRVLAAEEELAFELFNSLSDEQRGVVLLDETAPADLRGGGDPQPPQTAPEGLPAAKLSDEQRQTLRDLLTAYTENMPEEVAAKTWAAIEEAGFGEIHFAWAGANRPGVGHYYRIQGPTFLVEFVNTQPDASGNVANHIHSVWRDLSGDFGIPLKDHLHPHDHRHE